jgi:hypothetical protein
VAGGGSIGSGAAAEARRCEPGALDQHWAHHEDGSLQALGKCLGIVGDGTAAGTPVQLLDCDGTPGQSWVQQPGGSLVNPASGLCLDDPAGLAADGTPLRTWNCNAGESQVFQVTGGNPIVTSAPDRQCVDVHGDDLGHSGEAVDVWSCQPYALDQHWTYAHGTLQTLGNCLAASGDGTAPGTRVVLATCDGNGAQQWAQEPDGTVRNPRSGLCLDDAPGNAGSFTPLEIQPCTGATSQLLTLGQ